VLCGEADGHASFADRWGDHLRRSGANIAHGENTRQARLNQKRAATKFVPRVSFAQAGPELRTREHESLGVES
jgi:hypothetical protein